jgi:hypothetical protein
MIRNQLLIPLIAKLPLAYPLFTLSLVLAVVTFNNLKLGCFPQKTASKIFLQIVIVLIFLVILFFACWVAKTESLLARVPFRAQLRT